MENKSSKGSTKRVRTLYNMLIERGLSDRSKEWFKKDELKDISLDECVIDISLIERRAMASQIMLEAMTNENFSGYTRTFEIKPGELIVGVIPMGSLGFGKIFPNYLTEIEKSVAFFSNRDVVSVLGHNSPDYSRLLIVGLKGVIETAHRKLENLIKKERSPDGLTQSEKKKICFYNAVLISCKAVVEYAGRFADLAEKMAANEQSGPRKNELIEISRICRKVPYHPADTFHEALQSIYFVHLVHHSTASHVSLGRLDQVLQPYLEQSIRQGEVDSQKAQELIECFLIKCAERLTLTMEHIVKQDYCDFATGMGHNPFLVDQEISVNQFMQNIVLGGQTRDGDDATNPCTYLFLDACASVGLPTPIVNLRLHEKSPEELLVKASWCAVTANNGQPIIYNDKTIITAMACNSKLPIEEARDYVIDGCWEVLLNGKCDFTYNMVNMLLVMECALNGGALLSGNTAQLRGRKMSLLTPLAEELDSFDKLKKVLSKHLYLFTNKAGMEIYSFYCLEGSVTPVPLFSALLGNCLERGFDKTWGGADYNIGGIVFIGMPNVANALVSIKKFVYEQRKYSLSEVVDCLRHDFKGTKRWEEMKRDFVLAPKFGNNDHEVNEIMRWLTDEVINALINTEKISDFVFLAIPENEKEEKRVKMLRAMAEYEGASMKERFGKDFIILFTAGLGTFEQYAHFGTGCAASADGREKDQPVAPNFSPYSGTAHNGEGSILESMKNLGLDRFGAGVMLDICLDKQDTTQEKIVEVYKKFLRCNGSIMSLTIVGNETIKKVYQLCNDVRDGKKDPAVLHEFAGLNVRVGGWNGPFITLTKAHQEDYLKRILI